MGQAHTVAPARVTPTAVSSDAALGVIGTPRTMARSMCAEKPASTLNGEPPPRCPGTTANRSPGRAGPAPGQRFSVYSAADTFERPIPHSKR
jgi:hypothetical protein